MTGPSAVGFLDFFILEAGDYVEQLDGLLLAARDGSPDAEAMQRTARALRGSATMARLASFSLLAGAVERVARGLREGSVAMSPALRGAFVAAVDDCKILLHHVRTWGDADDARARARTEELSGFAPAATGTPAATPSVAGLDTFLATEASNIGAGLELLATRPSDRDAAGNVLRRVRALRGLASVKDHPALADVLEAAEEAASPLERGEPALAPERIALLRAAAVVLRSVAGAIREGRTADESSSELAAFATALDAMQARDTGVERVLPIAELFYTDGGDTIVDRAASPPTTPAERFRLEVVSQGEHLRRLVADARDAKDDLARERLRRGMRVALRGLAQMADSFAEGDVSSYVKEHSDAALQFEPDGLRAIDALATLLAQPGVSSASIGERMATLASPPVEVAEPQPVSAARSQAPASDAPPSLPTASPRLDAIDRGLSSLGVLGTTPLSTPRVLDDQPPVDIDVLLYRGRSAIERCREIRDGLRHADGVPDAEALAELYDLLDLALTE